MSNETPSRDEAVAAWSKYSGEAEDPADLYYPKRPEIEEVDKLYENWYKDAREKAGKEGPEASLEVAFQASTFYVDAGFSGTDYLDEVANDWLMQHEQDAEENSWNDLAARIKAKRVEINQRIGHTEAAD